MLHNDCTMIAKRILFRHGGVHEMDVQKDKR